MSSASKNCVQMLPLPTELMVPPSQITKNCTVTSQVAKHEKVLYKSGPGSSLSEFQKSLAYMI